MVLDDDDGAWRYALGGACAETDAWNARYRRIVPKRDFRVLGLATEGEAYQMTAYIEELKRDRRGLVEGDDFEEVEYERWLWERLCDEREDRRRSKLLKAWNLQWACRFDNALTPEQRDWLEVFVSEAAAEEVDERLALETEYITAVSVACEGFLDASAHEHAHAKWLDIWLAEFRDRWEVTRLERSPTPSPPPTPKTALAAFKATIANGRRHAPENFPRLEAAEADARADIAFSYGAVLCGRLRALLDGTRHRVLFERWLEGTLDAWAVAWADALDTPVVSIDALPEEEAAAVYYEQLRAARRPSRAPRGTPAALRSGAAAPLVT